METIFCFDQQQLRMGIEACLAFATPFSVEPQAPYVHEEWVLLIPNESYWKVKVRMQEMVEAQQQAVAHGWLCLSCGSTSCGCNDPTFREFSFTASS